MNRSKLVTEFSLRHNMPKSKAKKLVSLIFEELSSALAKGDRIEFRGFGSFTVKTYSAREAKNPRTGEKIWVEERKKVRFRTSETLNQKINDALL